MGYVYAVTVGSLSIAGASAWFYFIMYSWLWVGLISASTAGWIVGYALLFTLFACLTPFVLFGAFMGLLFAGALWSDA